MIKVRTLESIKLKLDRGIISGSCYFLDPGCNFTVYFPHSHMIRYMLTTARPGTYHRIWGSAIVNAFISDTIVIGQIQPGGQIDVDNVEFAKLGGCVPNTGFDNCSKSKSSKSATSTSKYTSRSKLGTPLSSDTDRQNALDVYRQMDNSSKWPLSSGRFMEHVMQEVLQTRPYQHPSQYCILDLDDDNWIKFFTSAERLELANPILLIDLPSLPSDMTDFLISIPNIPQICLSSTITRKLPLRLRHPATYSMAQAQLSKRH
ncbi:hypothetical protein FB192DRAFT_1452212 [Mucor lusitanicus]|uniref:Uncharacterized protein n=1 Tax=Mucor circinelloides f. lusitanicus TaxID=29924 RepID=A0A8H4B7X7_MUCCL|nr:hypothetical protein FB192DRAFT_1452212 [Mucor lusitanicus]